MIGAARADQRDLVADIDAERLREAGADRDAAGIVEIEQPAAVLDRPGDLLHADQVGAANAAHQHAGAAGGRAGGERLALDDRHRRVHAGHCGDPLRDLVVVGEVALDRLDDDVAVDAEDLVEKLDAEAVHHRHHDDERRDAEHDPEEREAGDDGDEGFLAARPEIAERQHPFERRERPRRLDPRRRGLGHRSSAPADARHQPIDRRVDRQRLALARRSPLDLDFAALRAARPDDQLPGKPDQVH